MNGSKLLSPIFIFLFLILGCKDEVLLETNNYKPILVIDGMITNEPGPYLIKISESSSLNNSFEKNPVENCIVTIFDNKDKSEILTEVEPGLYRTSLNGIQGEIGNSYGISIITPNKKEYHSGLQELKEPIEIKSIYAELGFINNEVSAEGLPGYQFYVDTEEGTNQENYFLWKSIETYEYMVDFDIFDIITGQEELDTNDFLRAAYVLDYKQKYSRCWKTQNVNYVYTGKTTNLSVPEITRQPLQFVGTNSKRLQVRYSLNTEQYTVNKDAYTFWQKIEKLTSNDNFLIASQPYNIIGNIKNRINPDELVFGYFTVASISQKRIFVNRPDKRFYYDKCIAVTDAADIYDIFTYGGAGPPYYKIEFNNSYGFGLLVYEYCANCTLNGGDNTKPDFWINQ